MHNECVIVAETAAALTELCGISILERLLRTLQRCGVGEATVLSGVPELVARHLAQPSWARKEIAVRVSECSGVITPANIVGAASANSVCVLRGDTVFDMRLLQLLLAQESLASLIDSAVPPGCDSLCDSAPTIRVGRLCGVSLIDRTWASTQSDHWEKAIVRGVEDGAVATLHVESLATYSPELRRNLRPFWFKASSPEQIAVAEKVLLDSAEKGSQDLPALVHAPIERFLIKRLVKTHVTPNQLTIVWTLLAIAATALFATGHLISGLIAALMVGIVDGLDGKQARLKVETTPRGRFEHRLDSFFDVAWPTALAFHFHKSGQLPNAYLWLAVFIAVQALDGIGKGEIYSAAKKLGRPAGRLDQIVRLFGGRRNVYVWILAVCMLLGIPAKSLIVMSWWEGCTAAVDLPHAAWALIRLRKQTNGHAAA